MKLDKYLNEGSDKIKIVNFLSKVRKFQNDLNVFSGQIKFDDVKDKEILIAMNDINHSIGDLISELIYDRRIHN